MVEFIACPVPHEQRPLEEYRQLSDSWFFAWPSESQNQLNQALLISWLVVLPACLLVASGSWALREHPFRLLMAGAVASLVLPLLLLVRQWLGWTFIYKRLLSEKVEYEESGWYDFQIWEKPLAWREQDVLVAHHQVRPILSRLVRSMAMATCLMLGGATLCQAL